MHRLPGVDGNDEMVKVMASLVEFHFMSKLPQLSDKDLKYMDSLAKVREVRLMYYTTNQHLPVVFFP
jgi:hypothetical protein